MCHLGHYALVGLVGDDVVEVGGLHAVGGCHPVEGLYHICACVDKHVASVGHFDTVFFRAQNHSFRTFADVAESAGVYCLYFHIAVADLVLRQEICHCGVAPQMSGLGVVFVGIIRIVFRTDQECFCGFAGGEVGFYYLKPVDERRACGRHVDCAGAFDAELLLCHVGQSGHGVVRRVGCRHYQVDIFDVVRQTFHCILDGCYSHRIVAFVFSGFRTGAYAGTLVDPFVRQSVHI